MPRALWSLRLLAVWLSALLLTSRSPVNRRFSAIDHLRYLGVDECRPITKPRFLERRGNSAGNELGVCAKFVRRVPPGPAGSETLVFLVGENPVRQAPPGSARSQEIRKKCRINYFNAESRA
eukprot:6652657-Alexandrium_andersonii.AAC.1